MRWNENCARAALEDNPKTLLCGNSTELQNNVNRLSQLVFGRKLIKNYIQLTEYTGNLRANFASRHTGGHRPNVETTILFLLSVQESSLGWSTCTPREVPCCRKTWAGIPMLRMGQTVLKRSGKMWSSWMRGGWRSCMGSNF